MNVVHRESKKTTTKRKSDLVRKDETAGIRGSTFFAPRPRYVLNDNRNARKGPNKNNVNAERRAMGPPIGPPPSLKRRIVNNSSSTKPESSSSGQPRVLANDSADRTSDFTTPKNRPTTLRYISSSSRGGHNSSRSARSTSTSVVEASVVLAISEGRGTARGEIGMAAIDLRHPHLVLCQFSDTLLYTHTLTKINYFNPIEILVPNTFIESVQRNQLYQLVREQYPLVTITPMPRRLFNDAAGRQQIQTMCAPQYSAVYLQVIHKFYAITAAAAALKYVENIHCIVFARESLKIEYHSSENTMIIDVGTATQLELVQPLVPSAGPTCCLLGVLGPTYTMGGIRALRAAILQPSFNKEFIEARLDAVQELIENDTGLMVDLQDVIKKLTDIDKILFLCIETPNQNMEKYGEAQLNQTLLLKTTMEMVPNLVEALKSVESGRLRGIRMDFENPQYTQISERIRFVIQDDAHFEKGASGSLQRCFAVKPNINGLLDVARRTYSELIDDIQKIVEQLSESYDLPIRLNQNFKKGFHIILPIAPKNRRDFNVESLPPVFIQVVFNGVSVTMSTEELVVLDQQAKESLNEIQKMSNIVITALLKELRPYMSSLYKLCENVAELDILLALAQASTTGSYIRPEFDNYLEVRNSVHPLLDYNTQVMPVPNDIFASPEYNFTIITGPNMGGKSIYIKQIALIQIMAQLGSFVPATNAVLRLSDRIFSRIGFNDNVEFNASSYVIEMKEIQHILKSLTPLSLVIIDELCRGTSIEEGTSIAWAICEELAARDAFTFFTTHFLYLTRLQDLCHNVINCYTVVAEESDSDGSQKRLVYKHKIERGVNKIEKYGLALAAKTNYPAETIILAKEIADFIAKYKEPQTYKTPIKSDEKDLYEFNARIRHESRKNFNSEETVKQMITQYKIDNPDLIERVRLERSIQSKSDTNNNTTNSNNITNNYSNSRIYENSDSFTEKATDKENNTIALPPPINSDLTTGYSNSDQEPNINKAVVNYIKTSTELLNTFIDENKLDSIVMETEQDLNEYKNDNLMINNKENNDNDSIISSFNGMDENNDTIMEINDTLNQEQLNGFNDDCNRHNEINDIQPRSFDLASASTQILGETFQVSAYSDEMSLDDQLMKDFTASTQMSVDELLMRETINEINEELMNKSVNDLNEEADIYEVDCCEELDNTLILSVDSLILTPPLQFRD